MKVTISTAARNLLHHRSGRRCEICGKPGPLEASHRVAVGMGGSPGRDEFGLAHFDLSKLIHACLNDHRTIEAHPLLALGVGWKVRRGFDPRRKPAWVHNGWYLLNSDGTKTPTDRPPTAPPGGPWNRRRRSGLVVPEGASADR